MPPASGISRQALTLVILAAFCLVIVPAAAAGSAALSVESLPSGAAVYLDNSFLGFSPVSVPVVAAGSHTVLVQAQGYEDYTETFRYDAGQPVAIFANMKVIQRDGALGIVTVPAGAALYLDNQYRGTTPIRIDGLAKGRHNVLLKKDGFMDYYDTVSVAPSTVLTYTEYLVAEPVAGFLGVASSPAGARAFIDGNGTGLTPTLLTLYPKGNHTVTVTLDGYVPFRKNITLAGGETMLVQADLVPAPTTGRLLIDSEPSSASVYLNGTYKGTTPAILEDVPAGTYSILLGKFGYDMVADRRTLLPGETKELTYPLSQNGSAAPAGTIREVSYGTSGAAGDLSGTQQPCTLRNFSWYAQGHETELKVCIPEGLAKNYSAGHYQPDKGDLPSYALPDESSPYIHELAGLLKDASGSRSVAARNDYHNVIAFVQSIPYQLHIDPATGKQAAPDYWKRPLETLADGNGDCIDVSVLAGALLKDMGYNVAVIIFPPVNGEDSGHAALGIACDNCNGAYYPLDGKKYYYIEMTSPANAPGQNLRSEYNTTAAMVIPL